MSENPIFYFPWITIDRIIILTLIFILILVRIRNTYFRWSRKYPGEKTHILQEILQIPIDNAINLNALLYSHEIKSRGGLCIVCLPPWGKSARKLNYLSIALAFLGHPVVVLDLPGHGKSGGNKNHFEMHEDIPKILDFLEKTLHCTRFVGVGLDWGATVLLNDSLTDSRLKCVIGAGSIFNFEKTYSFIKPIPINRVGFMKFTQGIFKGRKFHISAEENREISPFFALKGINTKNLHKIRLLHAKNDPIVRYNEFERFIKTFNIPAAHYRTFSRGNHQFLGVETLVVGAMINWIREMENQQNGKQNAS